VNDASPSGEPEGYAAERRSRIEQTVARDLARRRRMIRVYLALLIVPLAVAAAFMLFGRTDREVVEQEVEQQVAPVWQSYREIEPMLTEVRGVDERIESYERGQSDLEQRVAAVAAQVRELEPTAAAGREAREQVTELRRDWETEKRQLSRRIDAFELRLDPAARERGADPATPSYGAATRLDPQPSTDVEALGRRVKELEATVEALQREIRTLRAELRRR